MFPKLDKHCPFKAQLAEAMQGDLCTICSHTVHDLDAMTPEARRDFLNGSGTVCVRYRMPAALAAAALAASITALPVAAQDASPPPAQDQETDGTEIVGVFSLPPHPCTIVQTVRGRQLYDNKGCRQAEGAEKAERRARRKR
ncbi:MAG: hypothetical protein ACAH11_03700 [Sphingomonas sp.]